MSFGTNPEMAWVGAVIALALVQVMYFSFTVGAARGKYGVKAPATSGHETFERHNRVHQNTLEQLVTFLPAILLFGLYVDARIAAGLGVVYIIGRFIYASSYVADPDSRTIGFVIGYLANLVLLLGGLIGAILALV